MNHLLTLVVLLLVVLRASPRASHLSLLVISQAQNLLDIPLHVLRVFLLAIHLPYHLLPQVGVRRINLPENLLDYRVVRHLAIPLLPLVFSRRELQLEILVYPHLLTPVVYLL